VLRIRYYHQDHITSSSAITDANGATVEETAFYPFGLTRHEHRLLRAEAHYAFTQKEQDRESGLHYFEARYANAALARFTVPDPKYANPDRLSSDAQASCLVDSQRLNLYAYCLNNPIKYADPSGLDVWIPFVDDWDELDVGQTLLNVYGTPGQVIARVSNLVGGTDFDTRSILGQGVSAISGSDTAGDVAEFGVEMLAGGAGIVKHGIRATAKEVIACVANPRALAKETWGVLKHDVGTLFKNQSTSAADNAGGLAGRTLPGWHPQTSAIENSAEGAVLRMSKNQWVIGEFQAASSTRLAVQIRGGNAYKEVCEPIEKQADLLFGPDPVP
jgi:RHS repeat-associated protein